MGTHPGDVEESDAAVGLEVSIVDWACKAARQKQIVHYAYPKTLRSA